MKIDTYRNLFFILSILIFFSNSAQKENFELSLIQNGKEIKIKNNEAIIDKSPFALVYTFSTPLQWSLIAGNNKIMQNAFNSKASLMDSIFKNSEFGGADGYFNEDKSIRAWNGEIKTTISFEDEKHHSFDSIYFKGKKIYGIRTIEFFSTQKDELMVEEWKDDTIIIATSVYNISNKPSVTKKIQLILKEIENTSILDVKGKIFIEEGEAIYQEGCEGCGNLGSFEFKKDGKSVEFLLPGSDTFGFGDYIQTDNQVVIGKDISFTVSEDGKTMIDNKSGTKYSIVEE